MCDGKEESGGSQLLNRPGRLEDAYIIGVLIGRGSYSAVHKCLFKGKAERACKVYKKAHLNFPSVAPHINSLLKLTHPNLVQVHDVFESELTIEVITDLTCGEELLERIERCDHYTEKDAAQAVHTILLALQYLHSQELAHGGVYPENLLYESEAANAKLKLSEIAMPKKVQSPTTPPIYSVSDPYLSTIQSRCTADICNLGVLIYIMLFGSEPTSEALSFQEDREFEGEWSDVSASARNLISRLFDGQLSAEDALRHPWVCGSTAASRHMLDAQERLKTFNARRKLRATTHAIIATQRAMSIVKPFRNLQVTR